MIWILISAVMVRGECEVLLLELCMRHFDAAQLWEESGIFKLHPHVCRGLSMRAYSHSMRMTSILPLACISGVSKGCEES